MTTIKEELLSKFERAQRMLNAELANDDNYDAWCDMGELEAYKEVISDLRKAKNIQTYANELDEEGKRDQQYANTLDGEMRYFELARANRLRLLARDIASTKMNARKTTAPSLSKQLNRNFKRLTKL